MGRIVERQSAGASAHGEREVDEQVVEERTRRLRARLGREIRANSQVDPTALCNGFPRKRFQPRLAAPPPIAVPEKMPSAATGPSAASMGRMSAQSAQALTSRCARPP